MLGTKIINIGYNSNLPKSIAKINVILDIAEKPPKFPIGPTISRPGPILLNVAATAAKFVTKSNLSKDKINIDIVNITKYVAKKVFTPLNSFIIYSFSIKSYMSDAIRMNKF